MPSGLSYGAAYFRRSEIHRPLKMYTIASFLAEYGPVVDNTDLRQTRQEYDFAMFEAVTVSRAYLELGEDANIRDHPVFQEIVESWASRLPPVPTGRLLPTPAGPRTAEDTAEFNEVAEEAFEDFPAPRDIYEKYIDMVELDIGEMGMYEGRLLLADGLYYNVYANLLREAPDLEPAVRRYVYMRYDTDLYQME